jgi:hypothetical protein
MRLCVSFDLLLVWQLYLAIRRRDPIYEGMNTLRNDLLELHRTIVSHERASYERRVGPVNGATFVRVLVEDPAYGWLRPLSSLIVRMDGKDADRPALAAETRALVRPDFTGTPFQQRYAWLIDQSPDVAYAHGVVKQALRYAMPAWQEPSRSPAPPAS